MIDYSYEIVMVNDGSKDGSYQIMQKLSAQDKNIKIVSFSRNFGSHAAILCGLTKCTSDCAIVKASDLQEPTELILERTERWRAGYNVVLAVREALQESKKQTMFAGLYYTMVQKTALPAMPKGVFDVYLLDRKVIWALLVFLFKIMGLIEVSGWTTLFIFNLFSFGVIMLILGILGGYLWRTFDASRNRPPYIVEEENEVER